MCDALILMAKRTSPARKPRTSTRPSPPKPGAKAQPAAGRLIDQRIRDLGGWRGATLARMRALILEADPEMIEEWKWMGTPVWSHDGIVCTGEAYKLVVKHTFARGASLPDPTGLFNASLEGNTRRAIDIREGEKLDAGAFKALVKAAVALNGSSGKKSSKAPPRTPDPASAKAKGASRATRSRKPARSKA
ncbi:MAG: DUF1801 domain-containing protein [Kofleriaceae bacterium]